MTFDAAIVAYHEVSEALPGAHEGFRLRRVLKLLVLTLLLN
jgi:hypothetical protein